MRARRFDDAGRTAEPERPTAPAADKRSWKHLPDEKIPSNFFEINKLRGSNKQFCLAMGEKATGNHRKLRSYAKANLVWVVAQTPGARLLDVYFASHETCGKVSDALRNLSEERPAAKRRGKR